MKTPARDMTRRTALSAVGGAGLVAGLCGAAPAQAGTTLRLIDSIPSRTLPKVRRRWPMPKDGGQVFFIQRSMNPNTVVYAARFDAAGALDRRRPLRAYWRRYAEAGQTRALGMIERMFAYGISARANAAGPKEDHTWQARFAALPDLAAELRQNAPHRAALWARINNREYKMVYGFLDLDESGLIPKVVRLRLVTVDPAASRAASRYVTHMISVSGGDIL